MSPADKTRLVKQIATHLGFDRVGITSTDPITCADYLTDWLSRGHAGTMEYLHRNNHIRRDPAQLIEGAQSVIVVALNYHQTPPSPPNDQPHGRVAMYAWGDDYHNVVKTKLHALSDALHQQIDDPFDTRCCVDTVPILERELAARAGIGWIGKNTLVLHQKLGSYFFLGEIVTTLDLAFDQPATDHCGSCTRCLDACPTNAFPAPYQMDASKCISYLTIEHRADHIDEPLARNMGNWIFGCDICQQVCPFNQRAPHTEHFTTREGLPFPLLDEVASWTVDEYRHTLKGSAVKRAKLDMLKRNAAIAQNNTA